MYTQIKRVITEGLISTGYAQREALNEKLTKVGNDEKIKFWRFHGKGSWFCSDPLNLWPRGLANGVF